jgi:signal transduction histidine kinase
MSPPRISSSPRYPIGSALRYGVAAALGALALLLGVVIPTHGTIKVAVAGFCTLLVLVSAALGGFGPGLLCSLMCTATVAYWLEPKGAFSIHEPTEVVGAALFLVSGLIVSGISERMHRAMRVERTARRLAEQTAKAEQEAHEAAQQALEAGRSEKRARTEMLALVAHDLQDPLGVIDLNAGLIERAAEGDEEVRRRAAVLHRTVRRMSRLVRNVLSSSTLEAGGLSLDLAAEPLEPIFAEAIEEHEPESRAKSVRLDYELARDLPLVRCDRDRIIQVLSNLLGNALRFTPSGGHVWLTAEAEQGAIRLSVRDTGAGISADLLPKVFERYSRERRDLGGRTGLGLSIARAIVERHGGTIHVESEEGAGSTFSFTLPVAASRPDGPTAERFGGLPEPSARP